MNSKSLFVVCVSGLIVFTGSCTKNSVSALKTQSPTLLSDTQELTGNDCQAEQILSEEDWGIKVESARLSAAGYMVDFRFHVLDADKAAPIFDRRITPHMIDQSTGAKFFVPNPPKVGQLRSGGNIKEGRIYFIFFANPAKYVKSGDKITVEIGDFKVQDVVVN